MRAVPLTSFLSHKGRGSHQLQYNRHGARAATDIANNATILAMLRRMRQNLTFSALNL